jgi:hypothetical protein
MVQLLPDIGSINSVVDLAKVLQKAGNGSRFLFRGQNVNKPLLPKIARLALEQSIPYEDLVKLERKMLNRFKKESVPLLQSLRPRTSWDWLSIAQHQGLPTRLLDWTTSAIVGLWFAVSADPPNEEPEGALWVRTWRRRMKSRLAHKKTSFGGPTFCPFG